MFSESRWWDWNSCSWDCWLHCSGCHFKSNPHNCCKLWGFESCLVSWERSHCVVFWPQSKAFHSYFTIFLNLCQTLKLADTRNCTSLLQPNREDERARIEAAGGRVIHWKGYRVLGVLAMSRSIGMYLLHDWFSFNFILLCSHVTVFRLVLRGQSLFII